MSILERLWPTNKKKPRSVLAANYRLPTANAGPAVVSGTQCSIAPTVAVRKKYEPTAHVQ